MKIRIFTDGACSGNPGPGGWAARILHDTGCVEISDWAPDTTNNRMELKAVVEALKHKSCDDKKIDLYSDSAYVVNAVNKGWLKTWSLNGWKTTTGDHVKNADLWMDLYTQLKHNRRINIIKIKGHSGDANNERVDVLAKNARDEAKAYA
jgi:ribonuclease HI